MRYAKRTKRLAYQNAHKLLQLLTRNYRAVFNGITDLHLLPNVMERLTTRLINTLKCMSAKPIALSLA